MRTNINRFLAFLDIRHNSFLRSLLNFLSKPESATVIGLMLSVLLFWLTQRFEKEHDFYQSILDKQIESDVKLLEIVGAIISQDQENKNSKELKELKSQFISMYYGRTLFFESCFFKNTQRVEYIRDLKDTIELYYSTDIDWDISIEDIKQKTILLSEVFSNSYKMKEKENECLF